jgi:hypothetical integral membrane protein (TIGR02206 family)
MQVVRAPRGPTGAPGAAPAGLLLSPDHFAVVGLTIALNLVVGLRARRNPTAAWIPWFMKGLAIVQILNAALAQVYLFATGRWSAEWALPCQLCDAAIVASAFALVRPTPLAFELTYFWGLGGALQGLVTPALDDRFPSVAFCQFFIVHIGLVTAAVFLAFGLRMTPRPRAVLRMMVWTNGFAIVAGLASWITGGNYMFLRSPPRTGSVLDLLGGWPWYILAGEVLALLVFAALDLPFRGRRMRYSSG